MSRRRIGWLLPAIAVLVTMSAVPAFAEPLDQGAVPAVAAAQVLAPTGCELSLELALRDPTAAAAEICPVTAPESSEPIFLGGRTCRCSCGVPCKRDADCGPGGLCRPGITCC